MARVIIHLLEPEMNALHQLARQEYRPVKSQAALMIRNELRRLGLLNEQPEDAGKQKAPPAQAESGEQSC